MTRRRRSLEGATIGIMCSTFEHGDLLRASVHACGGHAILINQFAPVRNATVPLATAALVIDVGHPGSDQAITTALAARMPVLACAFGTPSEAVRARLKLRHVALIVDPDPDKVCDVLIAMLGAVASAGRRKRG